MMASQPRRSPRLTTNIDLNGRDYLASLMGWSTDRLEDWITSWTVQPHLQSWYQNGITNSRRYNDAIDWLNTGPSGYFYDSSSLEEDLLLACLGENYTGEDNTDVSSYANSSKSHCTTQDIWAKTVRNIVQANAAPGEVFERRIITHPAACYGFVIDLLCIAFHSIVYRGKASCYESLIHGSSHLADAGAIEDPSKKVVDVDGLSVVGLSSTSSLTAPSDDSMDLDFEAGRSRGVSKRKLTSSRMEMERGECIVVGVVERWLFA
ncbi:hypothetical protein B0A50_04713 [Salinomyces thailandicus]|uniref:Uncharacterized protein n=1 Tax=Salinomyces thailandicus TaxID=706561 RepID=A0A4U0TXQ0_9PEZI|nr:hypothetical protein B0A50_04713 [Salinomyces thailandica]